MEKITDRDFRCHCCSDHCRFYAGPCMELDALPGNLLPESEIVNITSGFFAMTILDAGFRLQTRGPGLPLRSRQPAVETYDGKQR